MSGHGRHPLPSHRGQVSGHSARQEERMPWNDILLCLNRIYDLVEKSAVAHNWAKSVASTLQPIWDKQNRQTQNEILRRLEPPLEALTLNLALRDLPRPHASWFNQALTVEIVESAHEECQSIHGTHPSAEIRSDFNKEYSLLKAFTTHITRLGSIIEAHWNHMACDQQLFAATIFEHTRFRLTDVEHVGEMPSRLYPLWTLGGFAVLEVINRVGQPVFNLQQIREQLSQAHSLGHDGPSPRQRQIYRLPPV
ncbi:hypothetical protein JCM10212_003133 [Sporobolomyces blumeae]